MSPRTGAVVGVRGIEAFGRHGVHDAERRLGQRFVVDLLVRVDPCPATETDRLEDTVDYAALADAVVSLIEGPPDRLLERLAARIADRVLDEPRATGVRVTVRKPHVAIPHVLAETAVTLARGEAPP